MTYEERLYDRQLEPIEQIEPNAVCPKCGNTYDPEEHPFGFCEDCEDGYLRDSDILKAFADSIGDDFFCRAWINMYLREEEPSIELRDMCRDDFMGVWQNPLSRRTCVIALKDFAEDRKSAFFEFVKEAIG